MHLRAVIYARYSSEQQSEMSLEDQIARCRAYADRQGWKVIETYTDAALSARSTARPSYERMVSDARSLPKPFDIVLAESLDRFDRRVANITHLRDVLEHRRIRLWTVLYSEITPMHAAVMGMVAEQYSTDLADKTRRGQKGTTTRGRVAAGLAYGYRAIPDAEGLNRAVCEEEAEVVRRIFRSYADGRSPRAIVRELNAERVPGPRTGPWNDSTVRGNAAKRDGLLRNRAYVGEIVYGRNVFSKDPETGLRTSRPSEEDLVVCAEPALRIVPQDVWDRVQARLDETHRTMARDPETGQALNRTHRTRYLLSGLLKCGCCGSGYGIMAKDRYGCSGHRNTGSCDNGRTIVRQRIEARVLAGIKRGLLAPELVQRFVEQVQAAAAERRVDARRDERSLRSALAKAEKAIGGILSAIEDGRYSPALRDRLETLETEQTNLKTRLGALDETEPPVLPLPNLSAAYARKVADLEAILAAPDLVQRAHEQVAALIGEVVLTPDADAADGLKVELRGDLARLLAVCGDARRPLPAVAAALASQVSVVAGAGFEPATFRL